MWKVNLKKDPLQKLGFMCFSYSQWVVVIDHVVLARFYERIS